MTHVRTLLRLILLFVPILLHAGIDCKKYERGAPQEMAIQMTNVIERMAYSPDGTYIVTAAEKTLTLWRVSDGRIIRHFRGHRDRIWALCISPDSRYLASADEGNSILLWEINGKLLQTNNP